MPLFSFYDPNKDLFVPLGKKKRKMNPLNHYKKNFLLITKQTSWTSKSIKPIIRPQVNTESDMSAYTLKTFQLRQLNRGIFLKYNDRDVFHRNIFSKSSDTTGWQQEFSRGYMLLRLFFFFFLGSIFHIKNPPAYIFFPPNTFYLWWKFPFWHRSMTSSFSTHSPERFLIFAISKISSFSMWKKKGKKVSFYISFSL